MAFGKGARGAGVRLLQERLASWIGGLHEMGQGGDMVGLVADGSYGQNTEFVVAKFQGFAGLSPTGYADDSTLDALQIPGSMEVDGSITGAGGGV